jgi:hypothetical protein
MTILDWLLGRKDPSAAWTADPNLVLEVDLSASTICGVGMGESFRKLAPLGPPENAWPSREESYKWPSRGVEIQGTGKEGIDTIILFWWRDRVPFRGRILWKGRALDWSASTRRTDVEALFGPPYHVDEDVEPVLYYEHGNVEWQIEFAQDGGLNEIMLTTPGLYADPEWRKRSGIAKPWPPAPGEGSPSDSNR